MVYIIKGTKQGKKYVSRKTFRTVDGARRYSYSNLVYNPSGDTKRKRQVTNIRILKK